MLTDELDRILSGAGPHARILTRRDGETPRTVVNPHLYSDVYDRLIRHPRVLGTAEELLDEQVYAFQLGINCKAAFNGDVWFWHQDYPDVPRGRPHPEPRMVNALIFLDEVTSLNGPLMLVPGSHRLTPADTEETRRARRTSSATRAPSRSSRRSVSGGVVAPTGRRAR